jgi:hypothetical protein
MTLESARMLVACLLLAAVASLVVGGASRADVSQTPVATACPAAFERLSVASLEAKGPYALPRRVDTAGNKDGYVCGLVLPDAARDADCRAGGRIACLLMQLGLPLYRFNDDDNPASENAQVAT